MTMFPPGHEPMNDRERLIQAAQKILDDVKVGHSHSQERIDWARSIINANLLWRPKQEEKK